MRTLVVAAVLLAACERPATVAHPEAHEVPVKTDIHSYARPAEARVTHLALELTADFAAKRLAGTAHLTISRAAGATQLVLDSRSLDIQRVHDQDGATLDYALGAADALLGAPLTIGLREQTRVVSVDYATTPEAHALQWLEPAQTSGGRQPFLFTQGQAILTRTWIPIQDSPAVRLTYEARVRVPAPLTAVMSAAREGAPATEAGAQVFTFRMPERIPAYLIALAVGDLAFRELGPRTGVYAEPNLVEAAAFEFGDTEKMVEAAEALYGPYRWGRYDILVLPPSFPFGGMENPRCTFVSPTVIAGDRSLVSLFAHERAPAWSGNLVTNATWSDFWLNEGTTVYFEGRIIEALYGRERFEQDEVISWQELMAELDEMGRDNPKTALANPLTIADDPDDNISGIPYIKGASFLRALERATGRDRFDAFMRRYFESHAFTAMSTERFLGLVRADLLGGDEERARPLELDAWAFGRGMPTSFPTPKSSLLAAADGELERLRAGAAPAELAAKRWNPWQWVHFLRNLPREQSPGALAALDRAFALSQSGNREVRFEWLRLAIASRYEPALASLEEHLTNQSRRKLTLPLYEALATSPWGRPIAERIYARARPTYHALTAGSVDQALGKRATR